MCKVRRRGCIGYFYYYYKKIFYKSSLVVLFNKEIIGGY